MESLTYRNRQLLAAENLCERGVDVALIKSDAHVRYLTGMPYGSVFFLFSSGHSILLPWDVLLAEKTATASEVIPYNNFGRNLETALGEVLKKESLQTGAAVELPSDTPHLSFLRYQEILPAYSVLCREEDLSDYLQRARMIKDTKELAVLRRACEATNNLVDEVIAGVTMRTLKTEVDVALFIEASALARGAEGLAFETLAAGPERSFGIHAFPACSAEEFGTAGMSILDFGVKVDGYSSDVTLTFVRGGTDERQELMISLVEEAYETAASMARPGNGTYSIAKAVDELFAREGFHMPHSLGHGIGLEVHEHPILKSKPETDVILKPGMVFTLEPGLYHAAAGGVRYENDFLITESGSEVLTNSRLIRL